MIELNEYREHDNAGRTLVIVNPDEIAAVRYYQYRSFRDAIGQVVLKCGTTINVWESVETIHRAIQAAAGGGRRG